MGMNDEISIDTIDKIDIDIENNRTLMEQVKEDYFIYYNSTVIVDEAATKKYWSDLGNLNISNLLSKSHRRAMVNINFLNLFLLILKPIILYFHRQCIYRSIFHFMVI